MSSNGIAAETLSGDIRDLILDEFRHFPKPWQKMTEAEQERMIIRATDIAANLVTRAVDLIAHAGMPRVEIQTKKFSLEPELIRMTATTPATEETAIALIRHKGPMVLVLADLAAFSGQREKAETDVLGDLGIPRPKRDNGLKDTL